MEDLTDLAKMLALTNLVVVSIYFSTERRTTMKKVIKLLLISCCAVTAFPATSAEKLVGPDGKILYYLHGNGRVSDPSGKTVGYMSGHRLVDPSGREIYEDPDYDRRYPEREGYYEETRGGRK